MGNKMTVVASFAIKSAKITKLKKKKNEGGKCKRIKAILIKKMRKHKLKNNLCSFEVVGHQA